MKLIKVTKNTRKRWLTAQGLTGKDIEFQCPHCSKDLVVAVEGGGRTVVCPQCQQQIRIPTFSEQQTNFNVIEEGGKDIELPDLKEEGGMFSGMFKSKDAAPKQKDRLYNVEAAQNKNTPPETLARLLSYNRSDLVSCLAVANPNCPSELVAKVAKKAIGSEASVPVQLVMYALRNPSCSPDVLSEVVMRSKVAALQETALANPNMGVDTLTQLSAKAGDDLKALIIKSANCPAEIVNQAALGKREARAAIIAAANPKCSSETITSILTNGFMSDTLSFAAIRNPNCSPEVIEAILMRDEEDNISKWAAASFKLRENAMRMVLNRNRLDPISKAIASRKECPKDAVQAWREATGQNR